MGVGKCSFFLPYLFQTDIHKDGVPSQRVQIVAGHGERSLRNVAALTEVMAGSWKGVMEELLAPATEDEIFTD